MKPVCHQVKVTTDEFDCIIHGEQTFKIFTKVEAGHLQNGDVLKFVEVTEDGLYTGHYCYAEIICVCVKHKHLDANASILNYVLRGDMGYRIQRNGIRA